MKPTLQQQVMLTVICFLALSKIVIVFGGIGLAIWAVFYL